MPWLAALSLLKSRWREAGLVLLLMFAAMLWFAFRSEHRAKVKAQTELAQIVAQEKAAAQKAKRVTSAQAAVTKSAEKNETAAQAKIRLVTQTIIQKVPTYVSAETDASFPLPWGLLRVYDASARGVDVSAVPIPAGQSDGQASPVKASGAATILAGNNGECLADRERLTALQDWLDGVQRAAIQ